MKEIKLRKYNQGLNQLFYSTRLEGENELRFNFSPFDEGSSWIANGPLSKIMMYTGVNDQNGKKIYEGDIVQIIHDQKPVIKQTVRFNHGKFIPVCDYRSTELKIVGNVFSLKNDGEP
ncbi:YopX family protein [Limosilactobacillus agrestis]|uniref:YopX family protein n=2 Tax=Limosilactobacillus TaxID=2742598 RepID=A0A7W3UHQ6_9LACO|nr:YopX family protein [Limosilactobacillus agrestis]MBB1095200.1 hypothetical protein [Limosilactobacillus agrestis]MCD7129849.1 YopX family protein [Limosilactobacillus agrestis]